MKHGVINISVPAQGLVALKIENLKTEVPMFTRLNTTDSFHSGNGFFQDRTREISERFPEC